LSCDEELMMGLSDLNKRHNLLINTHLSENLEEVKVARCLFPKAQNYTDIYANYGLLTDKCVLAHCIYLDKRELIAIESAGK